MRSRDLRTDSRPGPYSHANPRTYTHPDSYTHPDPYPYANTGPVPELPRVLYSEWRKAQQHGDHRATGE